MKIGKGIIGIISFGIGSIAGGLAGFFFAKRKYEKKFNDELNKELRALRNSGEEKENEPNEEAKEEKPVEQSLDGKAKDAYEKMVNALYGPGSENGARLPYIIPEDEFGDMDYDTITLTYFANGVLVDDAGDVIGDVAETIGLAAANKLKDYAPDVLYVRNDLRKADFEICYEESEYDE